PARPRLGSPTPQCGRAWRAPGGVPTRESMASPLLTPRGPARVRSASPCHRVRDWLTSSFDVARGGAIPKPLFGVPPHQYFWLRQARADCRALRESAGSAWVARLARRRRPLAVPARDEADGVARATVVGT